MKRYELKGCDFSYYRETLDNGLDLILLPDERRTSKKNYYLTFGTHYGALINEFIPFKEKKMKKFPHGIAHFLEHKCFEVEKGKTPFDFYSETGSYVNAFTSYDATCYVVSGSKNLKENLEQLLTFVTTPYFTDENVAKEKEIITEEIHMREDNPEYSLILRLNKNLYHDYPLKYPVSGGVHDIEKITKELLYQCYETFYQPENMFLIIGGCFDKTEVRKIVQSKMRSLDFKQRGKEKPKVKKIHEKVTVVKEEETSEENVKVEKIAIGYKMDRQNFRVESDILLDLYFNMILTLNFGSSSDFNEKVRREHFVSASSYSFDAAFNIRTLLVEADVLNEREYLNALEEHLLNLEVKEEDMQRMKKVWISSEVMKTDYMETMTNTLVSDLILYKQICNNYVELIRSMNMTTMRQILRALDFSNRSMVRFLPKNEQ